MTLEVRQFACLADNYGFILRDTASGLTACVDTPDAEAVLAALGEAGWGLDMILNTHWHPDHAGGNAAIKAATGAVIVGPEEVRQIAPLDRGVSGGDMVSLGATNFSVIDCGGHTLGHIAYFDAADEIAFVGDTLFVMGCGRIFEGDAEQMWASLQRLARLPPSTVIYCAHEYTATNARFALSIDHDPVVARRADAIFEARARGDATVPTTLAEELATNPFLRAPRLVPEAATAPAAFAQLRAKKDDFAG
jgi:hydroxyacylglutathione hydrolase